jgi:acetyltransferase-like isoleucine patch superfamily enzyme
MDISVFEPKIINSTVDTTAIIEPFCNIIDSELLENSKIYKQSWVIKTTMKENGFAGDGTKLDNCKLEEYSRVGKYNHLYFVKLGKHTYTGQDTIIMHTEIGAFTSISWGVTIGASEHDFNRLTTHTFLYNSYDNLNNGIIYYDKFEKECSIGNDVWIGANSTILRGVEIGDGAVIGANSIVTKSIPPYAVAVGNPAKVIKYRFDNDIIARLLHIKWWLLEDEIIRKNSDLFSEKPNHELLNKIESIVKEVRENKV